MSVASLDQRAFRQHVRRVDDDHFPWPNAAVPEGEHTVRDPVDTGVVG